MFAEIFIVDTPYEVVFSRVAPAKARYKHDLFRVRQLMRERGLLNFLNCATQIVHDLGPMLTDKGKFWRTRMTVVCDLDMLEVA